MEGFPGSNCLSRQDSRGEPTVRWRRPWSTEGLGVRGPPGAHKGAVPESVLTGCD